MSDRKFEFTDARGGSAIGVRVVTRATETEIAGRLDDGTLKIRLKASPAGDPSANEELIDFLAEQLGVPKTQIEIVAGQDTRDKIVSVEGMTAQAVESKLVPQNS